MLKKTIIIISVLLIFLILIKKYNISKQDISGVYIAQNLINNIDTLKIFQDGFYEKRMFRKSDKSLIYKNKGKWLYEEDRLILFDFFSDEDDKHSKDEGDFESVLITSSFPVERRLFKIVIRHMQLTEYKYYEKQ